MGSLREIQRRLEDISQQNFRYLEVHLKAKFLNYDFIYTMRKKSRKKNRIYIPPMRNKFSMK